MKNSKINGLFLVDINGSPTFSTAYNLGLIKSCIETVYITSENTCNYPINSCSAGSINEAYFLKNKQPF